jgi:hypothetical protein
MSRDPFRLDQERRRQLLDAVYRVRGELFEAAEADDAPRALVALKDAYRLLDQLPEGQLLHTGSDGGESFVLPAAARFRQAIYSGRCSMCEEPIRKGDLIHWVPKTATTDAETYCARCGGLEPAGSAR